MLIYRVQNAENIGMYVGSMIQCVEEMNYNAWGDDGCDSLKRMVHPCPRDDAQLGPQWADVACQSRFRFGFSSVEQLLAWIHKDWWREEIADNGFSVYVYEVDTRHVLLGDTQACFVHEYAAHIDTIELTEL